MTRSRPNTVAAAQSATGDLAAVGDLASPADLGPTAERLRHGPVERLDRAVADAAGRPARPYKAVDTLAVMERRGSITAGMRQAGEGFWARFATAQLDPLRALDLTRLRVTEPRLRPDKEAPGSHIEAARRAVWGAVQAVGGLARRPARVSGMCWAGSRRSRNGPCTRAGAAVASARRRRPVS